MQELCWREDKDPLNIKHTAYLQQLAMLAEAKKSSSVIRLAASHFSPSTFLKLVHFDTGFGELVEGRNYLEAALKSKDEVLKCLVKQNFDRFVRALNSIQTVHTDMQSRGLTQDDLVTRRVADSLTDLSLKAQDVFRGLVKETERKEQLKKRAAFFEKHHELFELPIKLDEYLKKSEFKEAIRAMKVAQMQLEELPLNLRLKVEQGLWVQRVIPLLAEVKEQLLNKLKSPIFSYSQHEHFAALLETLGVDVASVYADYLQRETLTAIEATITQGVPENRITIDSCISDVKVGNTTALDNPSWRARIGILRALSTRLRFFEEELKRFKDGFGKTVDCNKIEQEVHKYVESNLGFLKCTPSDTLPISAWQSLQAVDILKMDVVRVALQEHVQESLDMVGDISAQDWIILLEFTKKCWPSIGTGKAIESRSKVLLDKENMLSALAEARTLTNAGYPIPTDIVSSIQSKYIQSHMPLLAQTPESQNVPVERRLHDLLLQLTMVHASMHDLLHRISNWRDKS